MKHFVCEKFMQNSCKHCVSIYILEKKIDMAPQVKDSSATLTFVKYWDRTFGITCKHVVETMRRKQHETGKQHTFFVAVKNHHVVQDRFVFPIGDYGITDPDIAIREIHPDFPSYVGKIALNVNEVEVPPLSEIPLAIAVGFPDRMKKERKEALGYRIEMPCIHAIAENISKEGPSFSLRSELTSEPDIRDFSGMSGGPIYWSDSQHYGLLGITYEATGGDSLSGSSTIHLCGYLTDKATLEKWLKQVPKGNW